MGLALVSVSSTALVIRYVSVVPALTLAFWRMLSASLFLWIYSLIKKQTPLSLINKRRIVFAGVFLGLHFACFFLGVRYTSIANATLLATLGPVFTSTISFFQGKKTSRNVYVGLGIALFGIIIIQYGDLSLSPKNLLGNALSLLSSLFIAITFTTAAEIRKDTGNVSYGRTLFLIAAITIGLIAVFIAVSSYFFINDFLAVRSICILLLFYAREVLDSAFLQEPITRLFLVSVVYFIIVLAIYFGTYPYRLRDFLKWLYTKSNRPIFLGTSLVICSIILLGISFTY